MTGLRVGLGILGAGLLAMIVWGFAMGGGWPEVAAVVAMPWGAVTLADLYLGFILFAVVIFFAERNKWVALAWIAPLFFLGNIWSVLWLVLRAPSVAARLSAKPTAAESDPPRTASS